MKFRFLRIGAVLALSSTFLLLGCQTVTTSTPTATTTTVNSSLTLETNPVVPTPSAASFYDTRQNNGRGTPGITAAIWSSTQNPVIVLLSRFNDLWTPGAATYTSGDLDTTSAWDGGTPTAAGTAILRQNVKYVVDATAARTAAQAEAAFVDDRRSQPYSIIDGLGPLTSVYVTGAGATSTIYPFTSTLTPLAGTITSVPANALSATTADPTFYKYDDNGNSAGVTTGPLGTVVALSGDLTNLGSTEPSKRTFLYPRPWRLNSDSKVAPTGTVTASLVTTKGTSTSTKTVTWGTYTSGVSIVPALLAVRGDTPYSDSGFVSGHTNSGFMRALVLAYVVPQRFQELVTRGLELGNNRILAGMHSPLDVMGGRMVATAVIASFLVDPALAAEKAAAYTQAQSYLQAQTGTTSFAGLNEVAHSAPASTDRFADWATNKANFLKWSTFGFSATNASALLSSVPKNAEVLLETRQPYLTANQRREVLRTTSLGAGYPLLDDPEGWGRLNLFSAADGYGAFTNNVSVTMDASQGGFSAADAWKNNIAGPGRLTLNGTGTLTLTGANTYTGGTQVNGGTLVAGSNGALGVGEAVVAGGTLEVGSSGLTVGGSYRQGTGATTRFVGSTTPGQLVVKGDATLAGTLDVTLRGTPTAGSTVTLLTATKVSGTFATVTVNGTSSKVVYSATGVMLQF